jgi:glycosyltransferase involved in cell wall biosynthesis
VNDVHVVVPAGIDDPQRPSGGNAYDRWVCDGLAALSWSVREHPVAGPWPEADRAARSALADALARIPDASVVLVDGLLASLSPDVLVPEAGRLRLVVLVHLPVGLDGAGRRVRELEQAVLTAAAGVITTSPWTRRWLLERYPLRPDLVHVAEPGVEPAETAPDSTPGQALLCVGAVTPVKGHDLLLTALATLRDLPWRCVCVGSLDVDRSFADDVLQLAGSSGLAERVRFVGPRTGPALDAAYAAADVLVMASRAETYGMVATEALARGLPVIAAGVGGLPGALGGPDGGTCGALPGLLVSPEDPDALAAALRRWLGDGGLRRELREAAARRRTSLLDWSHTSRRVARVLDGVAG